MAHTPGNFFSFGAADIAHLFLAIKTHTAVSNPTAAPHSGEEVKIDILSTLPSTQQQPLKTFLDHLSPSEQQRFWGVFAAMAEPERTTKFNAFIKALEEQGGDQMAEFFHAPNMQELARAKLQEIQKPGFLSGDYSQRTRKLRATRYFLIEMLIAMLSLGGWYIFNGGWGWLAGFAILTVINLIAFMRR